VVADAPRELDYSVYPNCTRRQGLFFFAQNAFAVALREGILFMSYSSMVAVDFSKAVPDFHGLGKVS
jgi:hypothetical protein